LKYDFLLFARTINVIIKSTSTPTQHAMIVHRMNNGDVARKAFSIPFGVSVGGLIGVPDDRVVGELVGGVTGILDMRVLTFGSAALWLSRRRIEGILVGFMLRKIDGAAVGLEVCRIEFTGVELVIVALYDGFVVGISLRLKLGWLLRIVGAVVGFILEKIALGATVG